MHAIAIEKGFDSELPQKVEEEAKKYPPKADQPLAGKMKLLSVEISEKLSLSLLTQMMQKILMTRFRLKN